MSQIVVQLNPDVQPSGSDLTIVNAARRSFGKRSDWDLIVDGQVVDGPLYEERRLKSADKRLIEFLARGMTADDFEQFLIDTSEVGKDWIHGEALYVQDPKAVLKDLLWQWRNTPEHDTPFNHCFISFEIKAPIFVRAQLVKHEYTIMSEFSRRYITDDVEFYVPEVWRGASKDKKQGSADWSVPYSIWPLEVQTGYNPWENGPEYSDYNTVALDLYKHLISVNIAPEQARMVLPQSLMTSWTWSGTLGAMAKVCRLRLGKDAQAETRYIAEEIYKHLCTYYPVSAPALVKGC
jgi:thymidylate synthase (FAD)